MDPHPARPTPADPAAGPVTSSPHDETSGLSERDLAILELEKQWWKYPGAKVSHIHEQFEMTETRYYQLLDHLLDQPAAAAVEPQLVARLRRLRDARRSQRSARREGR